MKFVNARSEKTWCLQDMSKNRTTPLPVETSGGAQIDYDAALAGMSGGLVHVNGNIKTTQQGNTWDQDHSYENDKMS
jgi:hypothetical protein